MSEIGDRLRAELRYAAKCGVLDRYFLCLFLIVLGFYFVFWIKGQPGAFFGAFCLIAGYVWLVGANMQMINCKLTETIDEMNDKERRLRELQEKMERWEHEME